MRNKLALRISYHDLSCMLKQCKVVLDKNEVVNYLELTNNKHVLEQLNNNNKKTLVEDVSMLSIPSSTSSSSSSSSSLVSSPIHSPSPFNKSTETVAYRSNSEITIERIKPCQIVLTRCDTSVVDLTTSQENDSSKNKKSKSKKQQKNSTKIKKYKGKKLKIDEISLVDDDDDGDNDFIDDESFRSEFVPFKSKENILNQNEKTNDVKFRHKLKECKVVIERFNLRSLNKQNTLIDINQNKNDDFLSADDQSVYFSDFESPARQKAQSENNEPLEN